MPGTPIVHFEVMSRNGKRAIEFYKTLFGWKIDDNNPMKYGLVNTGVKESIQGGIGQVDGKTSPYVTFYIGVNDPQKYLDNVVRLGGKVVVPVTEIPNMVTYAQFADPEGNVVGLVKNAMPRSNSAKRGSRSKTSSRSTRK